MIPSLDNQSRAGVPIAVVTVTLVIATIAVFFRSYTRIYLVNRFGIDDWAAALALVCPPSHQIHKYDLSNGLLQRY